MRKKPRITIECACGCKQMLETPDSSGRDREYISGHNGRKYPHDDKYAYSKAWVKRNRNWVNTRRKSERREVRVELITRLGGKCQHCNLEYNGKNGAVFEFHHLDPSTKDFSINQGIGNYSKEVLIEEVNKCNLLCSNCHQIEHVGEY